MIGVIARMLQKDERVLEVNERLDGGYDVRTTGRKDGGFVVDEKEPDAFIERVKYDAGDIVVAPMVEALREWLSKGRAKREPDRLE